MKLQKHPKYKMTVCETENRKKVQQITTHLTFAAFGSFKRIDFSEQKCPNREIGKFWSFETFSIKNQ